MSIQWHVCRLPGIISTHTFLQKVYDIETFPGEGTCSEKITDIKDFARKNIHTPPHVKLIRSEYGFRQIAKPYYVMVHSLE